MKGKTESLLERAGYRMRGNRWFRTIDSAGCGLTPSEQEINRRGGRDYGTNADVILSREIADVRRMIEDYSKEEIEESSQLYHLRDWLRDATK